MPKKKKPQLIRTLKRQSSFNKALMALVALVVVVGGYSAVKYSHAATCTIDSKLVNSCRPWLGGFSAYNPGASGLKANITAHENNIGRQLDVVHDYHTPGAIALSSDDLYYVGRPNTILFDNWKPAGDWASAGGTNGTVNAFIKAQADTFVAAGTAHPGKKIMLTIWHEPENDVTGQSCSTPKASVGTAAQYVAMWQNVRKIFNTEGVNNVVWVLDYMGFANFQCMDKALWPGNTYVDWVAYDPYSGSNADTWNSQVSSFYNWMSANSDATHDFTGKPWALGEFGIGHGSSTVTSGNPPVTTYVNIADQAHTEKFYDDAATAIKNSTYPKIKLYTDFDSQGTHDSQIAYVTITHVFDATELAHYKAFANIAELTGVAATPAPTTPPPTTPPPTPTVTAPPPTTPPPTPTVTTSPTTPAPTPTPDTQKPSIPAALAPTLITDTQIALDWNPSSDNVGVKGYRLYRNGVLVVDQPNTGYSDGGLTPDTSYSYTVASYDAASNQSNQSAAVQVTTQPVPTPPAAGTPTPPGSSNPVTITPPGTSTAVSIPVGAQPVVGGTIGLNTTGSASPCANTTVKVDGTQVSSNGSLDTSYLTNGNHTVTAQGCDQVASRTVSVQNHLTALESIRNTLFASLHGNKTVINAILVGILVLLILVASYFLAMWGKKYLPIGPVKSNLG